jgi:hypothetical protein
LKVAYKLRDGEVLVLCFHLNRDLAPLDGVELRLRNAVSFSFIRIC